MSSLWYRLQVYSESDSMITDEVWARTWDEMLVVMSDKMNQLEQCIEVTWRLSRRYHSDKE